MRHAGAVKAVLLALVLAGAAAAQEPAQPQPAAAQPRQLFLLLYRPGPAWRPGVPMRRQDLRAHGAYHAQLVREGRSVAGGPYAGEEGGLAIIRAADMAEARAMLAADPAIQNGVFVAEVRHWTPFLHSDAPLVERAR